MTESTMSEYDYSHDDIMGGRVPQGARICLTANGLYLEFEVLDTRPNYYETSIGKIRYDKIERAYSECYAPVLGEGLYSTAEMDEIGNTVYIFRDGRWWNFGTGYYAAICSAFLSKEQVDALNPVGFHSNDVVEDGVSKPVSELRAVTSTDTEGFDVSTYCIGLFDAVEIRLEKQGYEQDSIIVPNSPKLRVETDGKGNSTLMIPVPLHSLVANNHRSQ